MPISMNSRWREITGCSSKYLSRMIYVHFSASGHIRASNSQEEKVWDSSLYYYWKEFGCLRKTYWIINVHNGNYDSERNTHNTFYSSYICRLYSLYSGYFSRKDTSTCIFMDCMVNPQFLSFLTSAPCMSWICIMDSVIFMNQFDIHRNSLTQIWKNGYTENWCIFLYRCSLCYTDMASPRSGSLFCSTCNLNRCIRVCSYCEKNMGKSIFWDCEHLLYYYLPSYIDYSRTQPIQYHYSDFSWYMDMYQRIISHDDLVSEIRNEV